MFFGSFFGRKNKTGKKNSGFGSFGGSMFDHDDFFSKGFGGSGFSSFQSSSTFGGMPSGMPGMSKSVSTTTKTV